MQFAIGELRDEAFLHEPLDVLHDRKLASGEKRCRGCLGGGAIRSGFCRGCGFWCGRCEQADDLAVTDAGIGPHHFQNGAHAVGEWNVVADELRATAADEGAFLVPFEKSQSVIFEFAAEFLHEVDGEALLAVQLHAQDGEEAGGDHFAGNVATDRDFADGFQNFIRMVLEEMRIAFRRCFEARRFFALGMFDGHIVTLFGLRFQPLGDNLLALVDVDAGFVALQWEIGKLLTMKFRDGE